MAPARNTTKAPLDAVISGLNGVASALAVYASSAGLLRTRRKTRFWLLAKLYQAGLVTRRVPTNGFRDASVHRFPPSQAFLAQAASPFLRCFSSLTKSGGRWSDIGGLTRSIHCSDGMVMVVVMTTVSFPGRREIRTPEEGETFHHPGSTQGSRAAEAAASARTPERCK
jgi:hypothetical protein